MEALTVCPGTLATAEEVAVARVHLLAGIVQLNLSCKHPVWKGEGTAKLVNMKDLEEVIGEC